jgi:hypothetical protein
MARLKRPPDKYLAWHVDEFQDDMTRLRTALNRAGYYCSDEDLAWAWHNWSEETHFDGWLSLDGYTDEQLADNVRSQLEVDPEDPEDIRDAHDSQHVAELIAEQQTCPACGLKCQTWFDRSLDEKEGMATRCEHCGVNLDQFGQKAPLERAVIICQSEPELPNEMPDQLWEVIKRACLRNDREQVQEILRDVVRLTKRSIAERIGRQC